MYDVYNCLRLLLDFYSTDWQRCLKWYNNVIAFIGCMLTYYGCPSAKQVNASSRRRLHNYILGLVDVILQQQIHAYHFSCITVFCYSQCFILFSRCLYWFSHRLKRCILLECTICQVFYLSIAHVSYDLSIIVTNATCLAKKQGNHFSVIGVLQIYWLLNICC